MRAELKKINEGIQSYENGLDYFYESIYCNYGNNSMEDSRNPDELFRSNIQMFGITMLGFISMLCSFLVALTIYSNENLRAHPNMLIAYLSIANIGSCFASVIYTIGTPNVVCYLQIA